MTKTKEQYAEEIIEQIDKLPPMPPNVIKLRQVCSNPNSNFNDLVPLIQEDPALCADILHMANSAFYGVNHQVDTISEAVRYFGMDHLIDFVSFSFSDKVLKKHFHKIKDLNAYFKHSHEISIAAKTLAIAAGKNREFQDFFHIAGLLHDIGRLIILYVSDEETTKLIGKNWSFIANLVKKEKECLGIDHCFVGMKICEKWKFSDRLQHTIAKHHKPLGKEHCIEAAYILLSHFIAMKEIPESMLFTVYKPEIMEELGLSNDIISKARRTFINEYSKSF